MRYYSKSSPPIQLPIKELPGPKPIDGGIGRPHGGITLQGHPVGGDSHPRPSKAVSAHSFIWLYPHHGRLLNTVAMGWRKKHRGIKETISDNVVPTLQ